jgi:hypothetical protein
MISGRARGGLPKELRGCIAASPIVPFKMVAEATYLFFFLAFFLAAIIFSSRSL